MHSFLLCLCLYSHTHTHMLMLAAYSLSALNGIVAAVKPRVAANIYGYKKVQLNYDQLNTLRGFGYENLAMSVFLLCLLNRVESHKSLGFASLVVVAHCAHHSLLGTTSSSLGVLGSLLKFIWMVFHASCAATFISTEVGYLMVSSQKL
jgi:hypothetical protein